MRSILFRRWWLPLLLISLLPVTVRAQKPDVDGYRARVITKAGQRFRGVLYEVTEAELYLITERGRRYSDRIPLSQVRKVVVRRQNKKNVLITGAVAGALLTGYLSNESLKLNQTRSPVTHGLTLTFAAAGGAAAGLLLSSAVGNLTSKVIRPLNPAAPETSLFRQLAPFTLYYQQDLFNRLPKNSQ